MTAPSGIRVLSNSDAFVVFWNGTHRVVNFEGLVRLVQEMNTRPIVSFELHMRDMVRIYWDQTGMGDLIELHLMVNSHDTPRKSPDVPISGVAYCPESIVTTGGKAADMSACECKPYIVTVYPACRKDQALYGLYYGDRQVRVTK